jgi:hypothetical protein
MFSARTKDGFRSISSISGYLRYNRLACHHGIVSSMLMVLLVGSRGTLVLDNRSWMHPFDDQGRRRDYADIPKAVTDLVDDPFRSLAGELRRAGGYAKDTTRFSEFLWADFLRRRIKRQDVEKDFDGALEEALKLAKGTDSDYLPGWCGAVTDD